MNASDKEALGFILAAMIVVASTVAAIAYKAHDRRAKERAQAEAAVVEQATSKVVLEGEESDDKVSYAQTYVYLNDLEQVLDRGGPQDGDLEFRERWIDAWVYWDLRVERPISQAARMVECLTPDERRPWIERPLHRTFYLHLASQQDFEHACQAKGRTLQVRGRIARVDALGTTLEDVDIRGVAPEPSPWLAETIERLERAQEQGDKEFLDAWDKMIEEYSAERSR